MTDDTLQRRNLRTLAALAALFLVPLTAAFLDYYASSWRPAGHVNHGQLITPARPLPAVALPRVSLDAAAPAPAGGTPATAFRGKWSLVYLGDGACDTDCAQVLYTMRQTRLALNDDMRRVERVFLVIGGGALRREFLAREHAGLTVLDATAPGAPALVREFPAAGREHTLYIVDPLGNLLMSYDARTDPHGLLEDLRKLLRLSHIG